MWAFSDNFIVLTCCIRSWHCDSNGDLNRGSNHESRDLKVRFEPSETAIWGKFLRFGLRDFKSLAICDVWFGALRPKTSQKWLGEGAEGLLDPGSKSHPRVFCTTQTLFCTGAKWGCTGARGVLLAGSKRPVAPSPNHFWGFSLFGQFPRSVASQALHWQKGVGFFQCSKQWRPQCKHLYRKCKDSSVEKEPVWPSYSHLCLEIYQQCLFVSLMRDTEKRPKWLNLTKSSLPLERHRRNPI